MLLGIAGRRESGKDTAGAHLIRAHGFVRYAFADPLKELCSDVLAKLGRDRAEIGWTGTDWTGPKSDFGRALLQGVGHGARRVLGHGIWVEGLNYAVVQGGHEQLGDPTDPDVVLTDVRYPNEAYWVLEHGGVMVRLIRPSVRRDSAADDDPTEAQIDTLPVHLEILNDRSIPELCRTLDWLVAGREIARAAGLMAPERYYVTTHRQGGPA